MGQKQRSQSNPLLVVERLVLMSLPVWVWLAWRYRGGYFITWGRSFNLPVIRQLITKLTGLRQLRYEEFPGILYEVQRLAITRVNDEFYDQTLRKQASPLMSFLYRFRSHPLMEVAMRRALLETYTLPRVKAMIMLRELARYHQKIVFVPKDSLYIEFLPMLPLGGAWKTVCIPRIFQLGNLMGAVFGPLGLSGFAMLHIVYLILQRGLVFSTPRAKECAVGFDCYDEGIQWSKPYHDSFIYDDRELGPQKVLHVIRTRLRDEKTRQHFIDSHVPFVEAGRLPIPVSYFLKRLIVEFWGGITFLALRQFGKSRMQIFLWPATFVVFSLIKAEVLEMYHRPRVFIGRDEYGISHIVRTILYDERHGVTIGFSHGDETFLYLSNSYLCSHVFCVWGEFQKNLLKNNTRHCRSTPVIGAGIYGLDLTYRHVQRGAVPSRYAELRKRYRLIGALPSSYAQDFYITKDMTVRFYQSAIAIAKQHPDVVVVIKPKGQEFLEPGFCELFNPAESRIILEENESIYNLIPALDLIICIASCTVGLEGLMSGCPVIYLDESGIPNHPYERYGSCLVARSPVELLAKVNQVLEGKKYIDTEVWAHIRNYHGLTFDGKVVERFRNVIYDALELVISKADSRQKPAYDRIESI